VTTETTIFPRSIPHDAADGLDDIDLGFPWGEDDDLVVGEEVELDGLGEGDDVELLAVDGLVVHGAEGDVVLLGGGLGHICVVARGGGHVEELGGADEGGVVDFHEVAFQLAFEGGSGGAAGFVADDEIEIGEAVEVLGVGDDLDGVIAGVDVGLGAGLVGAELFLGLESGRSAKRSIFWMDGCCWWRDCSAFSLESLVVVTM